MDFVNEPEMIKESFEPFYEGTILSEETDPDRLYSLEQEVRKFNLFTDSDVNNFVDKFYDDSMTNDQLQGALNYIVQDWKELEEDEREEFRSNTQSFIRLYGYIAQIIEFKDISLEKLFTFLKFLNKKLPRRDRDKLTDVASSINLEYFRLQRKTEKSISLEPNPRVDPPSSEEAAGAQVEEVKDFLSNIIKMINDAFGVDLTEDDKINFRRVDQSLKDDKKLRKIHKGNNTDTNKRYSFDEVFDEHLLGLVDKDITFYNKLKEKEINKCVKDRMYENYLRILQDAKHM